MKIRSPWVAAWLMFCALGCDSDRAADGARDACAEGGALGAGGRCDRDVVTAEDACDRLVRCAAIPRDAEDDNGFDWGRCVDRLDSVTPEQASFAIACVAASGCDDLKVEGSPNQPGPRPFCLEFGDR